MKQTTALVHEPPSADVFRGFEHAFKDARVQQETDRKTDAGKQRLQQVEAMIADQVTDDDWDSLMEKARKAAENGDKQCLLLRFPSALCTDDSRAINNPPDPTWPGTLRGEAAEIYQRWQTTLRPQGFDLSAQVLDFPGGMPGDVGLFLRWGE